MWNPGLVGDIQPIQTNYGKFGSGFNQQGWQHEMVGNNTTVLLLQPTNDMFLNHIWPCKGEWLY